MTLTRRQQDIYAYLRDNLEHFDHPPTLEELCDALGLSSRGSLHKHIQALVDADLLEPLEGKQRGIRLTNVTGPRFEVNDMIREVDPGDVIPFLGKIAAGRPIEALPQPEYMDIPTYLRREKPCYLLQVAGDSMIDEGILDGDYVIIEEKNNARNGEIVVALIHNENATLKRIEQTPDQVILYPANQNMSPMTYLPDEVKIQGVLVGQMRRY